MMLPTVVYAGYFFGQYPATILIGKYPAQRVLGVSCCELGISRRSAFLRVKD